MSKITLELDTEKKSGVVKVDGKTMKDVSYIYAYLGEYFNVEISSSEKVDDSTRKVTRIVASKESPNDDKDRHSKAEASKTFPGLLEYNVEEKDYTQEDLSKALLSRIR